MCTLEDEIKRGCSKKQVNICASEKKIKNLTRKLKKKKPGGKNVNVSFGRTINRTERKDFTSILDFYDLYLS